MAKLPLHNYLAIAVVFVIAESADLIDISSEPSMNLYGLNGIIDYSVFILIIAISSYCEGISQRYVIALLVCQATAMLVHVGGAWTEILYKQYPLEVFAVINDYYCYALRTILTIIVLIMLSAGNGIYRRRKLGDRLYNPAIMRSDNYISNQHSPGKKTRWGYF